MNALTFITVGRQVCRAIDPFIRVLQSMTKYEEIHQYYKNQKKELRRGSIEIGVFKSYRVFCVPSDLEKNSAKHEL